MLASIFTGPILKSLVGALLGPLEAMYREYINGQISKEQLAEKLQEAILASLVQIEGALYDSITKTYASFMQAAVQSKTMQRVWACVALSQLVVLLWHQVGIPALIYWRGGSYPSSGTTVDWAYALLALCLGAPALTSRIGPAATWAVDSLKGALRK